jgi:hypothetical protein
MHRFQIINLHNAPSGAFLLPKLGGEMPNDPPVEPKGSFLMPIL